MCRLNLTLQAYILRRYSLKGAGPGPSLHSDRARPELAGLGLDQTTCTLTGLEERAGVRGEGRMPPNSIIKNTMATLSLTVIVNFSFCYQAL